MPAYTSGLYRVSYRKIAICLVYYFLVKSAFKKKQELLGLLYDSVR